MTSGAVSMFQQSLGSDGVGGDTWGLQQRPLGPGGWQALSLLVLFRLQHCGERPSERMSSQAGNHEDRLKAAGDAGRRRELRAKALQRWEGVGAKREMRTDVPLSAGYSREEWKTV